MLRLPTIYIWVKHRLVHVGTCMWSPRSTKSVKRKQGICELEIMLGHVEALADWIAMGSGRLCNCKSTSYVTN
jgi:hypothetical protein